MWSTLIDQGMWAQSRGHASKNLNEREMAKKGRLRELTGISPQIDMSFPQQFQSYILRVRAKGLDLKFKGWGWG